MKSAPHITVNESGSLVTFDYRGHITAAGIQAHCDEIFALGARVRSGFTIVADLTDLEKMDPECAQVLSRIMEQLGTMGLSRVVRVIPDPRKDIGLAILSLFHYKAGIMINTVPNRAEARKLLG
jgi:hypothetical protein